MTTGYVAGTYHLPLGEVKVFNTPWGDVNLISKSGCWTLSKPHWNKDESSFAVFKTFAEAERMCSNVYFVKIDGDEIVSWIAKNQEVDLADAGIKVLTEKFTLTKVKFEGDFEKCGKMVEDYLLNGYDIVSVTNCPEKGVTWRCFSLEKEDPC